jgi:hypothetical protein
MIDITNLNPTKIRFQKKESEFYLQVKKAQRENNNNGKGEDFYDLKDEKHEWVEGELFALVCNDTSTTVQVSQYYYLIKVDDILDTYPCNQYLVDMMDAFTIERFGRE